MPIQQAHSVSVIIPTWKRGDLLRKCLESLRRQSFADFEVILVSNGAGRWVEELAQEFDCKLVGLAENRGFAAAVNAGIAASQSTYVVILNDDAELDSGWLKQCVLALQEQLAISFVCGKIYKSDGRTIDDVGNALTMGGGAWRLGHGRADGPEFDHARSLFGIGMTAAIFRRSVFDRVGKLDEHFISYLEDVDFSIRLWRAGLRGMYLPQAVARHHGGASLEGSASRERFRLMTRNQSLLLYKHYPWSLWFRLCPRIYWSQLLWALMALRQRRLWAFLQGSLSASRTWAKMRSEREPWKRADLVAFVHWLRESERAVYEDVAARPRAEQDTYWRMYFALYRPRGPTQAVGIAAELPDGVEEEKRKADPSSVKRSAGSFHSSG